MSLILHTINALLFPTKLGSVLFGILLTRLFYNLQDLDFSHLPLTLAMSCYCISDFSSDVMKDILALDKLLAAKSVSEMSNYSV